jgi:hypothetical protein
MQDYMLVACERGWSTLNNCRYYRFTWIDLDDLSIWETTVDQTFRNYHKKGWDRLCESEPQYGIYTGLRKSQRTSKQGYGILTADSRPELLTAVDDQDMACDIVLKLKG